MTSPADDLTPQRAQPSAPPPAQIDEERAEQFVKFPDREKQLSFSHRYTSGLNLRVSFSLDSQLRLQSVQINRTTARGEIQPCGFILENIPAPLAALIAPDHFASIASESRLDFILLHVENYNRSAENGAHEPAYFRAIGASTLRDMCESEKPPSEGAIFNQMQRLARRYGIDAPAVGARELDREFPSVIYSSPQPPSIRAWARGTDHSMHTIHTFEQAKGRDSIFSRLDISLTLTSRRAASVYLRYVNSNQLHIERLDEFHDLTPRQMADIIASSMELIDTLSKQGSQAFIRHLEFLERERTASQPRTLRPRHTTPGGAVIELDSAESLAINIYANSKAHTPTLIFYNAPPYNSNLNPLVKLDDLYGELKSVACDAHHDRISAAVERFYHAGGHISWNMAAPLPHAFEVLHEALREDPIFRDLCWVRGPDALPSSNRQILELLKGRQVVTIRLAEQPEHEFASMTLICKDNVLEEVFLRSKLDWAIDFRDFNILAPRIPNQDDFLIRLAHHFTVSPFRALEFLNIHAKDVTTNLPFRASEPFMSSIEHLSVFYKNEHHLRQLVDFASFPRVVIGNTHNRDCSIQLAVHGSNRFIMRLHFDPDGLSLVEIYRRARFNPFWVSHIASYEIQNRSNPERFYNDLVERFAAFSKNTDQLRESELHRFLGDQTDGHARSNEG